MTRGMTLAGLLGMAVAGYALAQDHPEHPKKRPAPGIEATVVGENFCLGCFLKKEKDAAAQCDKHGHRNALRVSTATADGKELPDMKGWVLHYLDTDSAQAVIKERRGESLTLKGKVYGEERVIEVGTVAEGKTPEHPEHPKKPEHPDHPKKK